MIEERFKEAIQRYVNEGCPMGGFITAVLENNLMLSIGLADEDAFENLKDIVTYLYNDVPAPCWGSKEKVKAWYAKKSEENRTRLIFANRETRSPDNPPIN